MESTPLISIVLSAYGDESALNDSVRSVLTQTFSEWELLLVCCGCRISKIGGMDVAAERRVRVVTVEEDAGCGAAWNAGLRHAVGKIVAYLLEGDTFYPDHLEHVAQCADRADVLLFSHDVPATPGPPPVPAHRRDPASLRANLFAMPIAEPLAVVHRRAWAENAAGFNELLWREEHWEFWK
ncbi:MAG: glycosyltransferase, partial [Patescibacteria group bacterium]|nr:glycosyltransferase [Patescibacteria group bacterium]